METILILMVVGLLISNISVGYFFWKSNQDINKTLKNSFAYIKARDIYEASAIVQDIDESLAEPKEEYEDSEAIQNYARDVASGKI